MNSLVSDDLSRETYALEAAKCLKEIFSNNQKVTILHKELLEINLSITAYIEDSKKRLAGLRLDLANEATSAQKVVEILSDKSTMSSPTSSVDRAPRMPKIVKEDNNNKIKFSERQQARSFITWYKHMIDYDRRNLGLYLSDDAILEWFGRTIKNRKKVTAFLKNDMQCSRHEFTSVDSIEKVEWRSDRLRRKEESILSNPLHSPEIVKSGRPGKRRLIHSCSSPEWADGCKPPEEDAKRIKNNHIEEIPTETQSNGKKRLFSEDETEMNRGDGMLGRSKRKCTQVVQDTIITPPNKEVGQGDCLPSTSGTDADRSHDTLNAQLPKLAVECNGYIEFARSRNSRSSDSMKWERKCKMQISYSEDPLNVGEYIIWMLRYTDETKCRRNLLAAFEEAAKEECKHI